VEPPERLRGLIYHDNGFVIAHDDGFIYPSEPGRYTMFPREYRISVPQGRIMGIALYGTTLAVFPESQPPVAYSIAAPTLFQKIVS